MPQLAPITLVAPGSRGLNTEKEFNLLPPQWATEANNCIITDGGRIGARKGWVDQTTTAISGDHSIDVLHEYIQKDGTKIVISAANNKVYKNFADFSDSDNDITSSTAPTADNWKFVNFNDYVLGVQKGHNGIQWQNSGDFTDLSLTTTGQTGTVDIGNDVLAAFGRAWYVDADLQTIRYSALLDHTDLSTANGGGQIDMSSVWTQGMDTVVAIAALGSNLVVFGRNHIVMWADDAGSEIGVNPNNLYVIDVVEGTGCIARDSVQAIGEGDLWFLSRHGIQSLRRVIQQKNNPLVSITKNVESLIQGYIATEIGSDSDLDAVRSVFSPEENFYLLILPTNNRIVCIDTRTPFQDEDGAIVHSVTLWRMGGNIKCGVARQNGDVLLGSSGVVGKYDGFQDNTSSYLLSFWSPWLDFQELNNRLKMLKELSAIIQITGSGSATYRWEFDFLGDTDSKTIAYVAPTGAEWGSAEWGEDEFAGALTIQRKNFPGSNQGQFIRVGALITVDAFNFIIQQLQLIPKVGRLAV